MYTYTCTHTTQFRIMSQHDILYDNVKNAIAWCTNTKMWHTAERGKQQYSMMLVGICFYEGCLDFRGFFLGVWGLVVLFLVSFYCGQG